MTTLNYALLTDGELLALFKSVPQMDVTTPGGWVSPQRIAQGRAIESAVLARIHPAAPILYQHSDGRYGVSLTGQPATFTTGDPEWYCVPLDVVEPAPIIRKPLMVAGEAAPVIRNSLITASDAGAVPVLTPSPGLRRAYQEVFNGAAPPTQPEKQAAPIGYLWRRHGRDEWHYAAWIPISDEETAEMRREGWEVKILTEADPPAPIQQPTGHSFDAGRAVWVSRDEAERMFPAPSQQAGADAPTRLMQWHDGAGLLWDVYAFGKWLHRVVSPLNWDAHAVYLDLQRAGYASHIDVQLVSPSNTAAPTAQDDVQLSGNSGELDKQGDERAAILDRLMGDYGFALPRAAYKQLRDALSRQPSAAASMGDVKLSEGDTVYYGDQVSGASLRYHSRDQIIEYANACVLADRQKRAQDGAKLCEHLRFAVTVLEENRQRIGYVPGSPIDVRVREARAALAAAKPEGGEG